MMASDEQRLARLERRFRAINESTPDIDRVISERSHMAGADGRNTMNGRFAAGNRYGGKSPGSPVARRMGELRRAVLDATTEDQVRAAFEKLREVAMTGEVPALSLYLAYAMGKPTETVAISTGGVPAIGLSAIAAAVMEAIGDDGRMREKVAAAFARLGGYGDGPDA
jgi:hypothetical protein